MNKSLRTSFTMGTVAVGLSVLAACGSDNPLNTLCCSDFKVGADLTSVDWEIEDPGVEAQFGALAQGVGDFSALAASTVADVAGGCRNIYFDLSGTAATGGGGDAGAGANLPASEDAEKWCQLAITAINTVKAEVGASATAKLTAVVQPPQCQAEASFQAKCDAKCNVDVSAQCQAELGDIKARCEPGKLSGSCTGKCTGSCTGSASAEVACTGSCSGQCSGECVGSASATVECSGSCDGACTGKCNGSTSNGGTCAGTCEGQCAGTCKLAAGAKVSCSGSCKGSCDATCTASANAQVECSGECKGSCDVEFQQPKCEVAMKPPSAQCQGKASADCNANCQASANARATCTPPRVAITLEGGIKAGAEAKFNLFIRTLEANLPNVASVFSARFNQMVELGGKLAVSAGNIAGGGGLSTKATACGVQIVGSVQPAVANLNAAIKAAGSVSGVVKLGG